MIGEIFEDRAGVIWIGTKAERPGQVGGLFRVDGDRAERIAFDLPSVEPAVRAIKQDSSGSLWLATSNGVWHLNGSAPSRVDAGFAEDGVYTIEVDREGNLWVGMQSGGLYRLKRRLATTHIPEHLRRHTFVPITGDGADGLWTGSICGGLWHFRNGVFEQYDGRHGLPGYCIWALHRDPNGTLWLGGSRGGVLRIENGQVTAMPRAGPRGERHHSRPDGCALDRHERGAQTPCRRQRVRESFVARAWPDSLSRRTRRRWSVGWREYRALCFRRRPIHAVEHRDRPVARQRARRARGSGRDRLGGHRWRRPQSHEGRPHRSLHHRQRALR